MYSENITKNVLNILHRVERIRLESQAINVPHIMLLLQVYHRTQYMSDLLPDDSSRSRLSLSSRLGTLRISGLVEIGKLTDDKRRKAVRITEEGRDLLNTILAAGDISNED